MPKTKHSPKIEFGDVAESGWINEEGVPIDDVDDAIRFLRSEGPLGASSSHYHPGVWYTQSDPPYDRAYFERGEDERHSFHLVGFSEAEQRQIFDALKG